MISQAKTGLQFLP